MPPKWPVFSKGRIDVPGNDSRHNKVDANQGGSPLGQQGASQSRMPIPQRGGMGTNGRDKVFVRAGMGGARSGTGNPATRGGFRGQARGGGTPSETRIPGHGGSPQHRGGAGTGTGFGDSGQKKVPTYKHANPQPGAGNTKGLAYRRIAGRFKRAAMGAKPTSSNSGKYGSPPVSANT